MPEDSGMETNRVELTGTTSMEPRVNEFGEGRRVSNIRIEVQTDRRRVFVRTVYWDDLADVVKDVTKGTRLHLVGRLVLGRSWTDRQGVTRPPEIEVHADEVTVLGKKTGKMEKVDSEKIKF